MCAQHLPDWAEMILKDCRNNFCIAAAQSLESQASGIKAEPATLPEDETSANADAQKKRSRKSRARRLSYVDNREESGDGLKSHTNDVAEDPDKQVHSEV